MATQKIFTPEEAVARLEKLPPEIRDIIYSPEMRAVLMNVGEKEKLHLDQISKLEAETSAVMLGFTESDDFTSMLVEKLSVDNEKATAIAKDMDELLFSKIRDAMKKTYTEATVPTPAISQPAAVTMPIAGEGKSVVMPSSTAAAAPKSVSPAPLATSTGASATPLSTDMQINAPASATLAPITTPKSPMAPVSTPAPTAASGISVPLHEVDIMLTTPTVSMPPKVEIAAKVTPPAPPPLHKNDPYREPIE